ncbi:MAG: hybrid sensor histidine kinase/response regulator [Haloplanus sp.]
MDGDALDILLVEDNPADARLVEHHLTAPHVRDLVGEVTLHHREALAPALDDLERDPYDVVFLDLGLPESTGLETLDRMLATESRIPVVVLTGLDDREVAVEAIQRGAQDYLPKDDLDAGRLGRSVRYAVERHRKEEKLRQQNERLDEFASVVSHDLRNPLNVAKGRVDLAAAECESEHLPAVAQAIERMRALTDDLLILARDGGHVTDAEPVDLAATVEECWQHVATAEATLLVETDRTIRADRSRLQQLFENLIRNAVEHGGPAVTITVGGRTDGFYVADDGSGVSDDAGAQVFESGYTTAQDGTGFGLQIVERISDAHGWDVAVTDSDDGGARFDVTGVDPVSTDG